MGWVPNERKDFQFHTSVWRGSFSFQMVPLRFPRDSGGIDCAGLLLLPRHVQRSLRNGGGGQENDQAANDANTALYTTFVVFGILGGGIYNLLGPHATLFVGCSTYVLYVGSFLYYNHHQTETFAVIAGGVLGVGGGLLWAGQGSIMTSYPTEDKKGRYISLFWSIFNLGGVIGGFIPFILNYHSTAGSVSDGTYIAFMCFMATGAFLSLALLPPNKVVRSDGSRATLIKYSNVSTEAMEILNLFFNWKMLLLVPASWANNFFYTYQFNNINGKLFTVRTRGFNNVFYWGAQTFGSVAIGYVLDSSFQSRKKKGFLGLAIIAVLSTAVWGLLLTKPFAGFDRPQEDVGIHSLFKE